MKTFDNKLEYISEFKDGYVDSMTNIRSEFIRLDNILIELAKKDQVNIHAARTIELCRTHLESSLMYAIKTICLLGEKEQE